MKIAVFNCPSGITAEGLVKAFHDAGLPRASLKKKRLGKETIVRVRQISRLLRRAYGPPRNDVIAPATPYGGRRRSRRSRSNLRNSFGVSNAIIGILTAIHHFQIEKCFVRNLGIGRKGNPRTLKLLSGFTLERIPVNQELVSPEGAAVLAALCEKESSIPAMRLESVGFGENQLMVSVGETVAPFRRERVLLLETNIDDMSPQGFELLYERLFKAGALDVWVQPILMKKMRPAFKLSVLLDHKDQDDISEVIFKETPSLGVRFLELDRFSLPRKSVRVKTRYGPVRFKIGFLDSKHSVASPEYEDLRRISKRKNLPFPVIHRELAVVARRRSKQGRSNLVF